MSDLRQLYQEVILDHQRKPHNFRKIEDANRKAEGYNPLCGDRITIYLKMDGDVISDVSFEGSGCAISTAAASLMTVGLKGKIKAEAVALFERFREMVTREATRPFDPDGLGKLCVFSGVCEFPVRVKCATLPWHTMMSALQGDGGITTTE